MHRTTRFKHSYTRSGDDCLLFFFVTKLEQTRKLIADSGSLSAGHFTTKPRCAVLLSPTELPVTVMV